MCTVLLLKWSIIQVVVHPSPSRSASNYLGREEESDGGRYHQTHQHHRHHLEKEGTMKKGGTMKKNFTYLM